MGSTSECFVQLAITAWLCLYFVDWAAAGSATSVDSTLLKPPNLSRDKSPYSTTEIFRNETLLVLLASQYTSFTTIDCNASYPVMWTLASLENSWASFTESERRVREFEDNSTYSYSMTLELRRNPRSFDKDDNDGSGNSAGPQEFICVPVEPVKLGMRSRVIVTWAVDEREWPWPYWNSLPAFAGPQELNPSANNGNNGTMGSTANLTMTAYQIYWNSASEEILIPSYSLRPNAATVELYQLNKTLEHGSTANYGWSKVPRSMYRFERFVGFFVNASALPPPGGGDQLFDCRVNYRPLNGRSVWRPVSRIFALTNRVNLTNDSNGSSNYSIWTDLVYATYSHLETKHLTMSYSSKDDTIRCCIKPEFHDELSSSNLRLYEKECRGPLLCLTKKHVLRSYGSYDGFDALSRMCRSHSASNSFSSRHSVPALYTCHLRLGDGAAIGDQMWTRLPDSQLHRREFYQRNDENAYLLHTEDGRLSTPVMYYNDAFKYNYWDQRMVTWEAMNTSSDDDNGTHTLSTAPVVYGDFYSGQRVQFRCDGAPFFFASGILWKVGHKNGTLRTVQSAPAQELNEYGQPKRLILKVDPTMATVSCYLPHWNSSAWVKRTTRIHVERLRLPARADGRRFVDEYVRFYAGESKVLECDLDGYPAARYSWSINSDVYHVQNVTESAAGHPLYHSSPSPSGLVMLYARKVSVSLASWDQLADNNLPIIEERISCIATNVGGSTTKNFYIHAIRPTKPQMLTEDAQSGHRSLNLYLDRKNQTLNCSIIEGAGPSVQFWWEKEGMNIPSTSKNFKIESTQNSSQLLFLSAGAEDEGHYTCVAANLGGEARVEFHVRVVQQRPVTGSANWLAAHKVLLVCLVLGFISAVLATVLAIFCVRRRRKIRLGSLATNNLQESTLQDANFVEMTSAANRHN